MTAMARPALLYFLLWLGVTLSSAMNLEKRIIGGKECDNNERHYHVKLLTTVGKKTYLCGGSLIKDQWVLTAAHCVPDGGKLQGITAHVNVHPGPAEEMGVLKHEIYTENKKKHDIMLLKLFRKPITVNKIDIPTAAECGNDIKEKEDVKIAGHGIFKVDQNDKYVDSEPPKLLCLDMPVVSCASVKDEMETEYPLLPYDNAFCAEAHKKEAAAGDSGGGALFKKKIYGIVISGHPTHAFKEPSTFMRVCKYRQWIEDTINKKP